MSEKPEDLEEQAEPLDRLEKRLQMLKRYGVRTYRDGRLSIDLGSANEPKRKQTDEQQGDALLRGQ